MAGGTSCNRDLWQSIGGGAVFRPKEFVAEEIKRNKAKLLKGLDYFKKQREPSGEALKKERKLQHTQLEFTKKLARFIGLDEVQSYDLFCSYLLHDYRGSHTDLQTVLSVDRHAQSLILKVRDYYNSERLYLLRCIKQMLSYWQEENHPYMEQYAEFMEETCENDKFIKDLLDQYDAVCDDAAPTWETHGNIMNEHQSVLWVVQNLWEQIEVLEIFVLFYRMYEIPPDTLHKLAIRFKKQGFGRRQTNKHLLDETCEPLVHRIGCLQVILLVEGMDLEHMYKCHQNNSIRDHHLIKSPGFFKNMDSVLCSLGDSVVHSPLLLMWAVVRQLALDTEGATITARLGNTALNLQVFKYLAALLETQPFSGKTTIGSVCQWAVYALVNLTLAVFHEDTLGDTEGLYAVVAKLLAQPPISHELWDKGLEEGVGALLQSALSRFPLHFHPLLHLTTALAKSSKTSANKVYKLLCESAFYSELLDRNRASSIEGTEEEGIWRLVADKKPYNSEKGSPVVQWEARANLWQLFLCEIHTLLEQISHGTGMVMPDNIDHVTQIAQLISALLTTEPSLRTHLTALTDQLPAVIQRFCLCNPPPLDLLSACLDTLTCLAPQNPQQVWHNVRQTGLVPYMTENFDNLHEAASGAGLQAGCYGSILAGYECTQGRYHVTQSILNLTAALIQPLHTCDHLQDLTAIVVFISREIFPVFHKWRYCDINQRQKLGQKCLEIFHKLLNILDSKQKDPEKKRLHLRDVCVYCLLHTESGRALLDIISTGVDTVEAALASQGSVIEGTGIELIQLIRLAFSVLNRLLLLRPADAPPSPVEHSLSARPASHTHRHVVAVIAQYIYHRHDPRLPTLATLLLKRLAMVFPMSIRACLGTEAEAIRDMYLARLQAHTEDLRLKVVILELLGACVHTQPGLTEMFLNLQPAKQTPGGTANKEGSTDSKNQLELGRTSCLQTLLSLIAETKQGTYQCPSDLLCAAMEFLQGLWQGQRETAMAVLREKESFWRCVCLCLMRDLPAPATQINKNTEVLEREVRTCSSILHILAQELYSVPSNKLDINLKKVLKEVVSEKRIQYWSQYLSQSLILASETTEEEVAVDVLADHSTLRLLLAWRDLTLVIAVHKPCSLDVSADTKDRMLQELLDGLQAQFSNGMTVVHIKLASVSSALYFTALKRWTRHVRDWPGLVEQLQQILTQTCANSETLIPSVQIGILGALTIALQYTRTNHASTKPLPESALSQLVPVVCGVLQQSTYQLPTPTSTVPPLNDPYHVKLKLQVVTVCLLEELIISLPSAATWLPPIKQHSILPCLLSSLPSWMQARKGMQYVGSVMLLLQTLARTPEGAETVAVNGLTHHLCLAVTILYDSESPQHIINASPAKGMKVKSAESWHGVYCHCLGLMTLMLGTLRYNFLQDTLDFVGVHQDRMYHCLNSLHQQITPASLTEAEQTTRLLHQVAHYRKEWRLHLPDVLNKLMTSVCYLSETCISLLIRPRLLQHFIEKQSNKKEGGKALPQDRLLTPVTRRLSQQSSLDETDASSHDTMSTQQRLLEILSQCLGALRQFSPDLCEILLDQSLDVGEYEPLLQVGFSTPSMDHDTPPTFGTLLSAINMCLRLLSKIDPKSNSPLKSPVQDLPIKRLEVMFVMENSLHLIMSQAVRYLRQTNFPPRDKQLLKRELSAELTSFMVSVQRHLRRGPTSPAGTSSNLNVRTSSSTSLASAQDTAYFRLVDSFINNVLK